MKHKIIILGAFLLVGGIALFFSFGYQSGLSIKKNKVSTTDAIRVDRSDKEKVAPNSIKNNNCNCEIIKFLMVDSPSMGEQKLTSGRFFKIVARDYYRNYKKSLTEISVRFDSNLAVVFPQAFEGAEIGEVRRNNGNGAIMLYKRVKNGWVHIVTWDGSALALSRFSVSNMPLIAVYYSTWSEGGTYSIYEWSSNSEEYQAFIHGRYTDEGEINFTECERVEE